jgi:hypothetical protein
LVLRKFCCRGFVIECVVESGPKVFGRRGVVGNDDTAQGRPKNIQVRPQRVDALP